jgi:GMP reductase
MDKSLFFKDILLKHSKCIVNSRRECDISTEIAGKKIACPVFCSSMPAVLNKTICRLFDGNGWFHVYHRFNGIQDIFDYVETANKENWNFCSISIGIRNKDADLLQKILNHNLRVDCINIDVALSWSDRMEERIKWIQKNFPNAYLIVGDGDHEDWIRWLEDLGIDAAKIYIGVSTACRTREYTGFGSTTISDLEKCANAANNIKIICDGGISSCATGEPAIGDIAKAIRFGTDYIQSGFLFSQCIDSPSIKEGYYGNSTAKAKNHFNNIEGTILNVKTNGLTIKEQMKLIEDSLRSSVSYAGGRKLKDLRKVDYIVI